MLAQFGGLGGAAGQGFAEFATNHPFWALVILAMIITMMYWLWKYMEEAEYEWL